MSTGRLLNPRRGLYCESSLAWVDPWVVASKLTDDAVLAWDGALSFHGVTELGRHLTVMSRQRVNDFEFAAVVYRSSTPPPRLRKNAAEGIETAEREGVEVRVTSLERTLVDCLDRLDLGPGLETLRKGFAKRELDGEKIVRAARLLRSQTWHLFVSSKLLDRMQRDRDRR